MPESENGKRCRPQSPKGIGLYIRAMPTKDIQWRVKRMADNGITWAAIGAIWQDIDRKTREPELRYINPAERCRRIADALKEHGIEPHLWGYPWVGREEQFANEMERSSTPDVAGWLLDPELGLKKDRRDKDFDTMDEVHAAGKSLFWRCVEANPYRVIGFTSYGQVKGHPTFPWDAFAQKGGFDPLNETDYGSPQLYDQPKAMISKGLREYSEIGFDVIVPSFGTYRFSRPPGEKVSYPRMNYVQLRNHLALLEAHRAQYRISAMIGWSEVQVKKESWRAIAACAERFSEPVDPEE